MLLLGFSEITKRLGLPLRLREMGPAPAQFVFDQFHYRLASDRGDMDWGRADSPLSLVAQWRGTPPALADEIEIARGAGAICFRSILPMQMNA